MTCEDFKHSCLSQDVGKKIFMLELQEKQARFSPPFHTFILQAGFFFFFFNYHYKCE